MGSKKDEYIAAGLKTWDEIQEYERKKAIESEKATDRKEQLKYIKENWDFRDSESFKERTEKLKNIDYLEEIKGMFKNDAPTSFDDRLMNVIEVVKILEEKSKRKDIKKGQDFSVSPDWAKKLNRLAPKMFDYLENIGKSASIVDNDLKAKDLQGFFNTQFVKTTGKKVGEANSDGTLSQYKDIYQQINQIENLIYDVNIDYSSNLRTRAELQELDEYKRVKVAGDGSRAKSMKESDIDKMNEYILKRNKDDFTKSPEAHVLAFLVNQFGMRRSTVVRLTIKDIDVKNGVIHVPKHKNKSNVSYTAIPLDDNINKYLGQIVQRAMEKNFNKLDDKGEIPLLTSSKSNQYKEYDRLLNNAGIDLEEYKDNKFHAARRHYGQAMWDRYRATSDFFDDKRGCKYKVNELLGHNAKEIRNLDSYVANMY